MWHQVEWETWLKCEYDCKSTSPLNSLFLHFFVARDEISRECAMETIETVFGAVPELQFIYITARTSNVLGLPLSSLFEMVQKHEAAETSVALYCCCRHKHNPVLYVRPARVEDNDDLVPLFRQQSDILEKTYGSYFLAEMIDSKDNDHKSLVAEVNGIAIGFMSLCSKVDLGTLNECFELDHFNGLYKPDPDDSVFTPDLTSLASDSQPPDQQIQVDVEKLVSEDLSDISVTGQLSHSERMCDAACIQSPSGQRLRPQSAQSEYPGESNAFCIQLFCISEKYETRSVDFLARAFEMMPDRQFCIVSVPFLVPHFPLLQSFTRATPRRRSTFPHELYVFHAAGLLDSFTVSALRCDCDVGAVATLVAPLEDSRVIVDDARQCMDFRRDADGTELQAFVAKCLDQVVGVAVLRAEEDIEYIRSHYNIEDFVYFSHHAREEHAKLCHFVLNPIFQHLSKHFMKEVLRLAHKTCLYYRISSQQDGACDTSRERHTLVTVLDHLVPVRARRQIVYPREVIGENLPSERVLQQNDQYALCHMNRKLTYEPKVVINARIVIVGVADTTIAFLETLAFSPHLRFNNITVISPHGLPKTRIQKDSEPQFLHNSECYTVEQLQQLALHTWVNAVRGKVTAIDRDDKYVVVDGASVMHYDYLVLCTGQQYALAVPSGADVSRLATTADVSMTSIRKLASKRQVWPDNVYVINDDLDARIATECLKKDFVDTDGKAVVYGSTLDAFATVHALLTLGIEGNRITLVEPPYNYQAFFCFQQKSVDYDAFKAINNSCLVYDGKLVIDATFHTNDVCIRAAGPLTKFARRYHIEPWTHTNFNSKEVGIHLAMAMLELVDPTLMMQTKPSVEEHNLIPIYRSPCIQTAILPGGTHYLHVTKPGPTMALHVQMAQPDYGTVLSTGSLETEDYFRLHINKFQTVETITCYSKLPIDVSNLICLYGLHENYLNNMLSRFNEGSINDFYSYFRQAWSMAVFHDRFPDFREEVREVLMNRLANGNPSLEEHVRGLIEEDMHLSKGQLADLAHEFKTRGYQKDIEMKLLSFVNYNQYHLPMYAHPGML
ncbi:PREDICTED: cilia- and flagella-associated protein 61-like isoform X2 [Priapulus caudatus]|uniref:Cilia- and flagella-associated protein 61-like isoform X2 n=1 Tax=Priapulus caudatus TaxID=37621 RepID=A0ABM1DXJ4_PRICU|nr:PREDICTED: cilia- and flagella-associated protein 61-like isoform X2 [Priapulus caudatus]